MGRPRTKNKEYYAVSRGLDGISGIYKEWTDCSKVVLNVKAAIYQGCETYDQAKSVLQNTGGTLQVFLDGKFLSCAQFEKSISNNNDITSTSTADMSDEDAEISFNNTVIQIENENELNINNEQTELKQVFTNCDTDLVEETNTEIERVKSKSAVNTSQSNPCICEKEINDQMLQCDICSTWLHYPCTLLPKYELAKYIKTKSKKFMCQQCVMKDHKLCTIITNLDYSENGHNENRNLKDNKCDSNFTEQLENRLLGIIEDKISQFTNNTLQSMQDSVMLAIDNQNKSYTKLSELVEKLHEQQTTTLKKSSTQNLNETQKEVPVLNIETNPKYQEMSKTNCLLRKEIEELKKNMQSEKHTFSLKEAELEFHLKQEKDIAQQSMKGYNDHMKTLQQDIESKNHTLDYTNSTLNDTRQQCSKLQKELELANDEILSLKAHIGSLSNPMQNWSKTSEQSSRNRNDQPNNENVVNKSDESNKNKKGIPKVILIGTSNVDMIEPSKFTKQVEMLKVTRYTVSAAKDYMKSLSCEAHIFIFHVLTNDIMTKGTEAVFKELIELVNITKSKYPESKIIISTATNRRDSKKIDLKVNCINSMIKEYYFDTKDIYIADNSILSENGVILNRFVKRDGRHLTEEGVKVLAANMRYVVENILGVRRERNDMNGNVRSSRQSLHEQKYQENYSRTDHRNSGYNDRQNRGYRYQGSYRSDSRNYKNYGYQNSSTNIYNW